MKQLIIYFWTQAQWLFLVINSFCYLRSNKIRVYYCGAISGNYGGAYVKIQRMKKHLMEHFFQFNVAYILSIKYLSHSAIKLQKNKYAYFKPKWCVYPVGMGELAKKIYKCPLFIMLLVCILAKQFCRYSANKFLGIRKGQVKFFTMQLI